METNQKEEKRNWFLQKRQIKFDPRLNFTTLDYNCLMEHCGFTPLEKKIFTLRQNGKTNIEIGVILNENDGVINRTVKKIKDKIKRYIAQT